MIQDRVKLRCGKWLGYAEFGDADGYPVFFFHGTPGSRLQRHPSESILHRRRIRLLTIDRPGYGLSDDQPDRVLLDWPDIVQEFADIVGIERFGAVGWSGGGPHAAACAHQIADRVETTVLVSSFAPLDQVSSNDEMLPPERVGLALLHRAPGLLILFPNHGDSMR
jgi:pimeloyl-ACP methyl ester carboxylesterase